MKQAWLSSLSPSQSNKRATRAHFHQDRAREDACLRRRRPEHFASQAAPLIAKPTSSRRSRRSALVVVTIVGLVAAWAVVAATSAGARYSLATSAVASTWLNYPPDPDIKWYVSILYSDHNCWEEAPYHLMSV